MSGAADPCSMGYTELMVQEPTTASTRTPPTIVRWLGGVAVLCGLAALCFAVASATQGGRWTGLLLPLALLGWIVTAGLVPGIPSWQQRPFVGIVGSVVTIGLSIAVAIVGWGDDPFGRVGAALMGLSLSVMAGGFGWMALGLRRQHRRRPDEPESWVPGRW